MIFMKLSVIGAYPVPNWQRVGGPVPLKPSPHFRVRSRQTSLLIFEGYMSLEQLRELNLNQLLALDALLQHAHVTRAAERLGLTQSAMSHTLRQLRERFGDALLVRGTGGLQLTPRAELLKPALRRVLQALDLILKGEVTFDPAVSTRTFHVSAGDALVMALAPPLLVHLRTHAPNVNLRVRPLETHHCAAKLESGELDIVLTAAPPDEPGLRQKRLFQEDFVCLARQGHPEIDGHLSQEQFVRLPHALISPSGEGLSAVDRVLMRQGLSRRIALRLPTFAVAPIIVASSDLLLTAPRRLAEALAQRYPLQLLTPPFDIEPFEVVAVWHERFDQDPALRWMLGLLVSLTRQLCADAAAPATSTTPPAPARA